MAELTFDPSTLSNPIKLEETFSSSVSFSDDCREILFVATNKKQNLAWLMKTNLKESLKLSIPTGSVRFRRIKIQGVDSYFTLLVNKNTTVLVNGSSQVISGLETYH